MRGLAVSDLGKRVEALEDWRKETSPKFTQIYVGALQALLVLVASVTFSTCQRGSPVTVNVPADRAGSSAPGSTP